jgi:hypothetical protein
MKTKLFAFLLFIISYYSHAQPKLELGINYFHQYVAMLGEEMADSDMPLFPRGFGANAQLTYKVTKNFGLRAGITYSKEGSGIGIEDSYYERQLDYIKFPLEIYVSSNTNKRVAFGLSLGLSTNYLVSANHLLFLDYDQDFIDQTGVNTDEEMWEAIGYNTVLPQKNDHLLKMDYSILGITEEVKTKNLYKPFYLSGILDFQFQIKLTSSIKLKTGCRIDAGFTDVENENYKVQTIYDSQPKYYWGEIWWRENDSDFSSYNISAGPYLGLSFSIK